jgi:hypothetical protein
LGESPPFPDFLARIQPSDSLISFGLGSGSPSPLAYLAANVSFFAEPLACWLSHDVGAFACASSCSGTDYRLPAVPGFSLGKMRVSQVPGSSS